MKLYSENKDYKLYQGSMLDMLEVIEPNSIDSIITDPPYELNFMNKGWDNSGIAFQSDTWKKCYKVLKPGAYLLAFGGSRTFHRIACAIEDAGFEIRDTIMWLYGSGFPKSHNIGLDIDKLNGCPDRGHRIAVANRHHPDGTLEPNGEKLEPYETKTEEAHKWNGWGTALKPSFEPIIVARKPIEGTVAKNCLKYGVSGINIDECRVGNEVIKGGTMPDFRDIGKKSKEAIGIDKLSFGQVENAKRKPLDDHIGRFPANTILTYDENDFDEVCGGFPNTKSGGGVKAPTKNININNATNFQHSKKYENINYTSDSGSASRYFYCAKASKKDRDEGLDEFETKQCVGGGGGIGNYLEDVNSASGKFGSEKAPHKNTHPTVKPTSLMQYLVRLITPNGGVVLDPFNGSGSTGKAVMYENKERNKNYKYIGIELTEEYLPIAKARIEYVCNLIEKEKTKDKQLTIFDVVGDNNE